MALIGLVERLRDSGQPVLLDTQWRTEHLASLGVVDVPRPHYLARLHRSSTFPDVVDTTNRQWSGLRSTSSS